MNSISMLSQDNLEIDELLSTIDDLSRLEKQNQDNEKPEETRPITSYDEEELIKRGLMEGQIQEIMLGLSQQLPVHHYAKECYNWKQMQEIRMGLLENVDTALYENPLFSAEQMQEIRLGLIDKLDVESYAKLIYTATDMSKKRRQLLAAVYEKNPLGFAKEVVDDETGIKIRISDNCMEAYMAIPEFKDYSALQLKRILSRHEIVSGIRMHQLNAIVQKKKEGEEILVAKGVPIVDGTNGYYEYFFNKLLPESPKIYQDGSVDYTNVIVAEQVKKGDVLAVYHPSTKGSIGETVTGIVLEGKQGDDLPALTGKGLKRDSQKNTYTATKDGLVFLDEIQYTLNIWNVFVVEGDINRYNGKISYDGTIHIRGSISDMAEITANGDVIVEGFVADAKITAGGNVILKKGMNAGGEGYIYAGGKVMGTFFEYVNIVARGNVEGNYFLSCNIRTDDTVFARGNKARIMGGAICAGKAVESMTIGNMGGSRTKIEVGDMAWISERMNKVQQSYDKVSGEIEQLTEGKQKLQNMLGDDVAQSNELFRKTCLAIQIKEEQQTSLERDLTYYKNLKRSALHAYVKATSKIQEGVIISVNDQRWVIREPLQNITIRKQKNSK